MKIIVFAGGSGKRFWPMSRIHAPKQFLNIIDDKPMVRVTMDRLIPAFGIENIYFDTGRVFEDEVRKLLPELPEKNLILENEMRDTGPAVTLAVTYVQHLFPGEVIACLWSDHLIKDVPAFIETLKLSERICREQGKIVFVTVPARFASQHRGYIQFGEPLPGYGTEQIKALEFKQFEEKPSVEKAQEFIESGKYGWNPGYWIFTGEQYLKKLKHSSPQTVAICEEIVSSGFAPEATAKFATLEKISADYMFAEKVYAHEAAVVYADFGWSDIGEWISLKEALQTSPKANVTKGNIKDLGSKDTLIYNLEEGKLVATIGLDGYVVVNTPDVVAIFPKSNNMKLKELLKQFEGTDLEKYL